MPAGGGRHGAAPVDSSIGGGGGGGSATVDAPGDDDAHKRHSAADVAASVVHVGEAAAAHAVNVLEHVKLKYFAPVSEREAEEAYLQRKAEREQAEVEAAAEAGAAAVAAEAEAEAEAVVDSSASAESAADADAAAMATGATHARRARAEVHHESDGPAPMAVESSATTTATTTTTTTTAQQPAAAAATAPAKKAKMRSEDIQNLSLKQKVDRWQLDPRQLRVLRKLGEGTNSKVYLGQYTETEGDGGDGGGVAAAAVRPVAVKVLKQIAEEDSELEAFRKELDIISSVRSEHVLAFYGVIFSSRICLVMEFCARGSLYDMLLELSGTPEARTVFTWPRFFALARGVVQGIHALHNWEPPIVHRDVKSQNFMITEAYAVKCGDFGVSRFRISENESTLGKLRGTYAYTAPEIYFGAQYTATADIYSLAVIFWELVEVTLNGVYRRPYSDQENVSHDFQIIILSAKENIRPTMDERCPLCVRQLIERCWDKDPAKRPDSATLLAMLDACERDMLANTAQWEALRSGGGGDADGEA